MSKDRPGIKWKDGKPYGDCGRITWYCPYDSIDPKCCQYKYHKASKDAWEQKEILDKEYGKIE